jgi:hypothetical protein
VKENILSSPVRRRLEVAMALQMDQIGLKGLYRSMRRIKIKQMGNERPFRKYSFTML